MYNFSILLIIFQTIMEAKNKLGSLLFLVLLLQLSQSQQHNSYGYPSYPYPPSTYTSSSNPPSSSYPPPPYPEERPGQYHQVFSSSTQYPQYSSYRDYNRMSTVNLERMPQSKQVYQPIDTYNCDSYLTKILNFLKRKYSNKMENIRFLKYLFRQKGDVLNYEIKADVKYSSNSFISYIFKSTFNIRTQQLKFVDSTFEEQQRQENKTMRAAYLSEIPFIKQIQAKLISNSSKFSAQKMNNEVQVAQPFYSFKFQNLDGSKIKCTLLYDFINDNINITKLEETQKQNTQVVLPEAIYIEVKNFKQDAQSANAIKFLQSTLGKRYFFIKITKVFKQTAKSLKKFKFEIETRYSSSITIKYLIEIIQNLKNSYDITRQNFDVPPVFKNQNLKNITSFKDVPLIQYVESAVRNYSKEQLQKYVNLTLTQLKVAQPFYQLIFSAKDDQKFMATVLYDVIQNNIQMIKSQNGNFVLLNRKISDQYMTTAYDLFSSKFSDRVLNLKTTRVYKQSFLGLINYKFYFTIRFYERTGIEYVIYVSYGSNPQKPVITKQQFANLPGLNKIKLTQAVSIQQTPEIKQIQQLLKIQFFKTQKVPKLQNVKFLWPYYVLKYKYANSSVVTIDLLYDFIKDQIQILNIDQKQNQQVELVKPISLENIIGGVKETEPLKMLIEILKPIWNIKPIETGKPVEPLKPVDPVKPIQATKPLEPIKLIEPVKPVFPSKQVEPRTVEPSKLSQPTKPIEPVKPAQSIKPLQSVKLIQLVKLVLPTKPVESMKLVQPVKSIETAKPVKTTQSTKPLQPIKLIQPVKLISPSKQVQPLKTIEPVKSFEPVKPIEAKKPVEYVQPVQSAKPVEPVKLIEPVKTVEPFKLINPIKPGEPIKLVESIKPVEPIKQVEPTKPVQLVKFNTIQPIKLNQPLKPVEIVKSVETIKQIQPAKPLQPSKSIEPARPNQDIKLIQSTKQIQSTKSVLPTKLTEPEEQIKSVKPTESVKPIETLKSVEPTKQIQYTKQVQPAKLIEFVKLIQPVKLVDPVKQAQPTKPIQPVKLAQPTKPIELLKPAQSTKPIQSVKTIEPVQQTQSTKSIDTPNPIEPLKPIQPVKLAQPIKSIDPTKPIETLKIAQPTKPIEIMKPIQIQPVKVIEPGKPTQSVKTIEPAKPAQLTKQIEIVKPAQPTKSIEPVKPAQSTKSIDPMKPIEPVKQIEPVTTTEPAVKQAENTTITVLIEKPVQSIKSVEPVKLIEPVKTAEIMKSIEPIKHAESVKSAQSTRPVQHAKPVQSTKQLELVEIVEPTKSIETVKPVEPVKPIQPVKPTELIKSVEPEKSIETVKIVQPVKPVQPVKLIEIDKQQIPTQQTQLIQTVNTVQTINDVKIQHPIQLENLIQHQQLVQTVKAIDPISLQIPIQQSKPKQSSLNSSVPASEKSIVQIQINELLPEISNFTKIIEQQLSIKGHQFSLLKAFKITGSSKYKLLTQIKYSQQKFFSYNIQIQVGSQNSIKVTSMNFVDLPEFNVHTLKKIANFKQAPLLKQIQKSLRKDYSELESYKQVVEFYVDEPYFVLVFSGDSVTQMLKIAVIFDQILNSTQVIGLDFVDIETIILLSQENIKPSASVQIEHEAREKSKDACLQKSQANCIRCSPKYYVHKGECYKIEDQCLTYNDKTGQCLSCAEHSLSEKGRCIKIDPHCKKWQKDGRCVQCQHNFDIIENKCVKQTTPDQINLSVPVGQQILIVSQKSHPQESHQQLRSENNIQLQLQIPVLP